MPITSDGNIIHNFNVANQVSRNSENEQSDDIADSILRQVRQQTERTTEQKQFNVSEQSKKFESIVKDLLGGKAGPDGKRAAETAESTPLFQAHDG